MIGKRLKPLRLFGFDAKVMQLNLSEGPRQRRNTLEDRRIAVFVRETDYGIPRICHQRGESNLHFCTRRDEDSRAQTENWIEHGANGIR